MGYTTRKEAKEAGWFSRRHKTSSPHYAAVAKYEEMRGRAARVRRAQERGHANA